MNAACNLRGLLIDAILYPLFLLMFSIGLLVFVYGVVEFLYGLNAQTEARNDGKKHMLYGVAGMFIMFAAYSIVQLILYVVGVDTIVQCPT